MTASSMTRLKSQPVAQREFSRNLRQTARHWAFDVELCPSQVELILWRRQLELIAAEASFLGFSRVVQLCKITIAGLTISGSELTQTGFRENQTQRHTALIEAMTLLDNVVQAPAAVSLESMDQAIKCLESVFKVSKSELCDSLDLGRISELEVKPDESNPRTYPIEKVSDQHFDSSVYCKETLDTLDHCIEEESWIVSQLAGVAEDLATGLGSERPALKLMQVLQGHKFFQKIDRVCLAGRTPNSNQLVVVDSAVSERSSKNTLKKGYSCFVNPYGSLFSMQPSTVRVFGESTRVLDSFHKQGKPAQRSIALIAEQGLRSGLCIAIGRGTTIQGFLFLNSIEPDFFVHVTGRFAPLLSLFGMLGTLTLDASGFQGRETQSNWPAFDHVPNHSVPFGKDSFVQLMENHLNHWFGNTNSVQIDISPSVQPFLYLPRMVIESLTEVLLRMPWNVARERQELTLSVGLSNDEILFSIPHSSHTQDANAIGKIKALVDSLNSGLALTPARFENDGQGIRLVVPFEPTMSGAGRQLYSIVH